MTTNHNFLLNQEVLENKIKIEVDGNTKTPIYMYLNDGQYIMHENDMFYNMLYLKEEERGFYPKENLSVPGRFEIDLKPRESKEITFVASLEEKIENIDSNKVFKKEKERLAKIVDNTEITITKSKLTKQEKEYNELIKDLVVASDSFIINRPSFKTHSILAGFPWFLDWGRDTLIAY